MKKAKKKTVKRLKIVVHTNSLTEAQYPAYTNHCQFWFRLGRSYPHIDFIFANPSRMSIDRARNMAARVALETKADYLMFLDDDVLVNPNYGLQQLLDCDADVAAGKVCVRGWPFDYMSFQSDKTGGLTIDKELPKNGIVNRDAVGFSFALIKTDILRRLQEPYFVTGINHTEDIYFCVKARQVDPKCSIKVNCDCVCAHILWPEALSEENREAYMEYFAKINKIPPQLKVNGAAKDAEVLKQVKDRGLEYLIGVKRVAHETRENRAKA